MRLTLIGHMTVLVELDGLALLTDPLVWPAHLAGTPPGSPHRPPCPLPRRDHRPGRSAGLP